MITNAQLDALVCQLMEKHHVSGLAAAVVKDGRRIWSRGFGLAHIGRQVPVTAETLFRVASISKTVTATAVMQLVEQGLCHLDEDVSDYLGFRFRHPQYPDNSITLRQLLTHTSGLQDEYVSFVVDSRQENPPSLHLKELLLEGGRYYSDRLWGGYPPGDPTGFVYSNTGALLLATAVERLSGERFDQYVRTHIFDVVGMERSSFNLQDVQDPQGLAALYSYSEQDGSYTPEMDDFGGELPVTPDYTSYQPGTNGALFSPQGGLRTSANELSLYLLAHMGSGEWDGRRILRQETAEEMQSVHWSGNVRDGFFRQSGLSFHITEDLIPGRTMIGHAGDAYGLLSAMYFDKQSDWGFVLMMNGVCQKKEHGVFFQVEEDAANLLFKATFR